MSDNNNIKIDLTLKDLDVSTASVILKYLGGDSPAASLRGKSNEVAEAKEASKKSTKKKSTKKKPEEKPEPKIEVVDKTDDDDDWDDDGKEAAGDDDDDKYASIKKWRELATVMVADGFDTEEKLLEKCRELKDTVPALEKIPDDNLVTRCSRAIELLGA